MNLKIIAREFLILTGIVPCLLIVYIFLHYKKLGIEKDIRNNRSSYDSVMNVFGPQNREYYRRLSDRKPFYQKVFNYNENGEYISYSFDISIWERLENLYANNQLNYSNYSSFPDEIRIHLKKIGINSFNDLYESVESLYISPVFKKENKRLEKRRDYLRFMASDLVKNRFGDQKTFQLMGNFAILYILLLFGVRYFLFSVIWSIKTIRRST